MNDYQKQQWVVYRGQVIAADGYACTVCGAKASGGALLQVHHVRYIPGLKPWDYPPEYCRTLCRGCHAAEHGHFPPKVGWVLCGEDDLGGLDGHCDVCGEALRYVFSVFHPAWGVRDVGTDCCDRMTATSQASEALAERKRRAARLQTFLNSPRWFKPSATHHALQRDGFRLVVRFDAKARVYLIEVDRKPGKQRFATMDAAKERLFHILDAGELDDYRRKRDAAAAAQRRKKYHSLR